MILWALLIYKTEYRYKLLDCNKSIFSDKAKKIQRKIQHPSLDFKTPQFFIKSVAT